MKRLSPSFAFAGFEILRYFSLAWILDALVPGSPPQILRLVAAPNLLFAVAFFFLALDPVRYGVYRPLILVGKTVAFFAALATVPRLAGLGVERLQIGLPALSGLILVAVWDVGSALVLLFRRLPVAEMAETTEAASVPEVVEVD